MSIIVQFLQPLLNAKEEAYILQHTSSDFLECDSILRFYFLQSKVISIRKEHVFGGNFCFLHVTVPKLPFVGNCRN